MNLVSKLRAKLLVLIAAAFWLVLVSAQSSGQQKCPPAQPESSPEPDLINPDRPGIADGSNVIGAKRFQIESGGQMEFRRSEGSREHTFFVPTLLRFGIDSSWEVRIEGNTFTRVTTFDSGNMTDQTSGFAPTSIGFKFHLYNSNGDHQISLGTIVRVFPDWGSREFRTQHTNGDIRLAADWNFAPCLKLSLNPNIGLARYEDDQGRLFTAGLFAITLNYQPTKRLNPFIDLGVQFPEVPNGKSAAILDGGVAYIIGRNLQLDAGIGTRVRGESAPQPLLEFGISWRSKSHAGKRQHN